MKPFLASYSSLTRGEIMLSARIQHLLNAKAVTPEIRAVVEGGHFDQAQQLIRKQGLALGNRIMESNQGTWSFDCLINIEEVTSVNRPIYDLQQLYGALAK